MSIPLAKDNSKDSINTSIIAIKRQIERINMLLGLVDSGNDPDLSGFATKTELQDAVTELDTEIAALAPVDEVTVDNMHSVTSNAVASKLMKFQNVTGIDFNAFMNATENNPFTSPWNGLLFIHALSSSENGVKTLYVKQVGVTGVYGFSENIANANAIAFDIVVPMVKGNQYYIQTKARISNTNIRLVYQD